MNFDRRVQCSRVGLEVNKYDTPAGGIRASQGTFSSLNVKLCLFVSLLILIVTGRHRGVHNN